MKPIIGKLFLQTHMSGYQIDETRTGLSYTINQNLKHFGGYVSP